MTLNLSKRLAALEANQPAVPIRFTPNEAAEAARRYEATLYEDDPTTPEAEAYFATVTLKQITAVGRVGTLYAGTLAALRCTAPVAPVRHRTALGYTLRRSACADRFRADPN